ncbi:Hypothetical protein Cp4202_1248 [Corynebacterium pseudotuberculosis 42/02-A]|nr:Hypothetical protein Cp4202_1248 [Corynebacterium pseudotuberculosis 42/02-A]AEX39751.1 Putative membrane protein [Corynebacterium pseudotuberculosis 3/99-5]AFF22416.1 Putative membrane protein [Corynebacterium pseudotuberculosis P54B96]
MLHHTISRLRILDKPAVVLRVLRIQC